MSVLQTWIARVGGVPALEHALSDVRFAVRLLRRSPVFTLTVVLSLGLGIGANTALFTLADALLLRTLPVPRPHDLVLFRWSAHDGAMSGSIDGSISTDEGTGVVTSTSFSYPTFKQMHAASRSLSSVFAFAPVEQFNVVVDGDAQIAHGQLVSGDYYAGLGVGAVRGRVIVADDDRLDATPAAVISYAYWQRRFGGNPSAIGTHVVLNTIDATIVGVTPPGFAGALQVGEAADITLPIAADSTHRRDLPNARFAWLRIMGRLAPGTTSQQAAAELQGRYVASVAEAIEAARHERPSGTRGQEVPHLIADPGAQGLQELRRAYDQPLAILCVVLGLVLLLACANVATLLLARAPARAREVTVRLAVGANRARLIRQLLTESIVLALLGETLGIVLAVSFRSALLAVQPWGQGALDLHLGLDTRVLAATTVLSIATGLLFGVAPALRVTRVDLTEALKADARGASRAHRPRLVTGLVVVQVAMCVLLLVVAGLFIRTLHNLRGVDVGWNANGLLLFRVDPRLSGYRSTDVAPLYERLMERIAAAPNVRAVTYSRHPQLSGSRRSDNASVIGRPTPSGVRTGAMIDPVGPDFFTTIGLPIVIGRAIGAGDGRSAPRVVVINETMAHQYFGNDSPLGARVQFGGDSLKTFEIVGVAKDARYYSVRQTMEPTAYTSYNQTDAGQANVTVRFAGDVGAMSAAVRQAVHDVDKNLPMFDIKTQRDAVESTMTQEQLFARLAGFFGALAVLLACLGVYGVMSYSTAQRTREIGVRMALGAQAGDIARLVMTETLAMVLAGALIGVFAADAATRVTRSLLFGVTPTDPATILGAVALIVVVGSIAGYLPARRARRISPMTALRDGA